MDKISSDCPHPPDRCYTTSYIVGGEYCGKLNVCKDCGMETCMHTEQDDIDGIKTCIGCGVQSEGVINNDKDWKYYSETKSVPTRCHNRKENVKSITPYVIGKNLPTSIVENANTKYLHIKSNNVKCKNNKAIIAACIYSAFVDEQDYRSTDEIGAIFGLNKKNMSDGLDVFHDFYREYLTIYIEPVDLIRRILIKCGISLAEHYIRVKNLCDFIINKSVAINRSTPQSICCAVVYLYLCMPPQYPHLKESLSLTRTKYTELVNMSEITVLKICKNMINVLEIDDVRL